MSQRIWLLAWLLAVIAATLLHQPAWLAAAVGVVLLVSGRGRLSLLRRAAGAVAPIAILLSSGYLLMAWFADRIAWDYLLLLNLRLLLLALLSAWVVRDLDLDRALRGSPVAQRWLSIVRSQLTVFKRLAAEYRAAATSRSTVPPALGQRYRAAAAVGLAVLDKAMYNSEALVQGMRSRGAFDD